jgi:predicted amidohydrolase YtcJ
MVTIDAAYTLGMEEKIGGIATGKFADFAVLNQDPYVVPKEKIRDVQVWGQSSVGLRSLPRRPNHERLAVSHH